MGQYFCQALGALKSYPAEDTAGEQETETKQETKEPKSEASYDRCVKWNGTCIMVVLHLKYKSCSVFASVLSCTVDYILNDLS